MLFTRVSRSFGTTPTLANVDDTSDAVPSLLFLLPHSRKQHVLLDICWTYAGRSTFFCLGLGSSGMFDQTLSGRVTNPRKTTTFVVATTTNTIRYRVTTLRVAITVIVRDYECHLTSYYIWRSWTPWFGSKHECNRRGERGCPNFGLCLEVHA